MGNIWAKSQSSISSSFFDQKEARNFPYHYFRKNAKGGGGGSVGKSSFRYTCESHFLVSFMDSPSFGHFRKILV